MGEEDEQESNKKKQKGLIMIPSYQEVFEYSQPKPPPSLFRPSSSSSFSQAFSFIKSSEFYSPPPPPPSPSVEAPRQAAQSDAPAPAPAPTSVSSSSPYPSSQSRNAILVGHRQKGNPLLKHIRNVRWMFADVVCDYLLGQSSCALYLSLRYHLLHPDYLYFRIRELQKNYKLRVVLCHVDVEDVVKPLLEVTRTALLHDCTLLCAWSYRRLIESVLSMTSEKTRLIEITLSSSKRVSHLRFVRTCMTWSSLEECGRYLETLKVYENKSADSIQERTDTDYLSRLTHALTAVRHVNKTDVVTLGSTFGSLSRIMDASMEDLARCPGIGERKVKRLYDTFHEPFRRVVSKPTTVQDSSLQDNAEPSPTVDSGTMETEEKEAIANKHGKEPSVSVRSALTAAFAKYAEKVGKQDTGSSSHREKSMETSSAALQEVKTGEGGSGEKQC